MNVAPLSILKQRTTFDPNHQVIDKGTNSPLKDSKTATFMHDPAH